MSESCESSHVHGSSLSIQERTYRHSKLIMTLPFDQNLVKQYITDAVLSRTQRRWEWFAEGQTLCSGLGTLVYLPAEVRRLIWKLLFECRATLSSDGLWEYDYTCGPIFDLSAYYFGFGRRGLAGYNGFQGLRLVSSIVSGESDEAFLTFRTFRFNQAANLAGFIDQLTPVFAERLKSFEIGICTLCKSALLLYTTTERVSFKSIRFHGPRILMFIKALCFNFITVTCITIFRPHSY